MALFCKIELAEATEISPLFGVGQENFGFELTDIGNNKPNLKFEPNMTGVSRVGLNAYGFGVGYSFRGSSKDLDPAKGSTTFYDLQLGYHTKNWGLDSFYQTYKGFYTESTQTLQTYPDLEFQHYGLMGRYALSESEFSVGGLLDQSESIRSTAGKYYLLGGFRHHRMQNTNSLLQQDYIGLNPELENLRELTVGSFNLGLGAGKYWVSDSHYFIGGLFDLVGTYGVYHFKDTAEETSSSYSTLSYDVKIGMGYAGDFFKTGLGFSADVTTLRSPGASYFRSSAQRFLFYIRFIF